MAFISLASVCRSQTAPPTLEKVKPSGAERGTRVTVAIEGTNIAGATRMIFSEPGLSSDITAIREIPIEKPEMPKGVVRTDAPIEDKAKKYEITAVVTIRPDVPHGVLAFRLETPLGVSNLLRFAVSALPEIVEREPNGPAAAQKVTLPAALVGALETVGDIDAYEFHARAGQDMVFQVVARPLGSRIDSVLRLLDPRGQVVAENNDFDLSRDSVLTWHFTEAGPYTLAIEDVEHGGGKEGYAYRIYAGALPYITSTFPLGVPAGQGGTLTATGVNLGSVKTLDVTGNPSARIGATIPISISTPAGSTINRRTVTLGRYPEVVETEPNDDLALAQKLAVPSTVNGRIWTGAAASAPAQRSARADQDVYRFTARKGQKIVFDVTAQQLGSPLDSIIEVLDANGRVVPRATIRCLAQTEISLNDPDSGRRSIRLAAWNDIAINDDLMVGDELVEVASMPTHPDDDIQLKSYRGGRLTLLDTSARNHSVGEAVYKVEVHPPGARLEPNGMPVFRIDYVNDDGGTRFGGKDSRLHFEAPADGDYFVRLRDVRGLEGERFAYRLTVREPAPDFDVTFDPKSFNIPKGGRVSLTVTADRKDGFDGPIDVALHDLPAGLSATSGTIAAGADTTVLMVSAAEDASLERGSATLPSMWRGTFDIAGVTALKLTGHAVIDGRTVTHEAEVMDPVSIVALAPKPDLLVTTNTQQIELAAGQEVTLTVAVERRNGFTARVPISVMNLPHGVRVNDIGLNGVMITEQETSRTMHIVAEPWVAAQTVPILVVGRVEVNSPLRNESAALPVQLVIKHATTTASR
ncbi:MAG: hypothetical protein DMF84_01395 [Acidobacteria bacterium]|nr:MAG: hypothetical protein DMF84_01395 [Acidobacteriota bacterium]